MKVSNENREFFLPLIPPELHDAVKLGRCVSLGQEKEGNPAGVLLYSLESGMDDDGMDMTVMWIHFLAVAEAYRNQGVGNALMQELTEIQKEKSFDAVVVGLPDRPEYNEMTDLFKSWEFSFELLPDFEMIITKEDCTNQIRSTHREMALSLAGEIKKPVNLFSITEIPEEAFQDALKEFRRKDPRFSYRMPKKREAYEADLSYVIMDGNRVSSIILFGKYKSNELHMALFASHSISPADELLTLLHYTASWYYLKYPEDATIRLMFRQKWGRILAMRIFPEKKPYSVRMGLLYQ